MHAQIERTATGIDGLDELLEGGIPAGSLNMLSGRIGTGRMIFSLQFLYRGANEKGEPGVFVSLEKDPQDVADIMKSFGWDPAGLMEKKMLSIIKPDMHRFETLKDAIIDEIDRIGAKRVVIKPFSLLTAYFDSVYDVRKALSNLKWEMKRLDCPRMELTSSRWFKFISESLIFRWQMTARKKLAMNGFRIASYLSISETVFAYPMLSPVLSYFSGRCWISTIA